MVKNDWRQKAVERIERTPVLQPHREVLLYDWPEGSEHFRWVATAPVRALVEWAKVVDAPSGEQSQV